jgi:sec-independent protein translocase protein TatA
LADPNGLDWKGSLLQDWVEVAMGEGLFQPLHLLVIVIVALLVFGPKKIPELGKGLGEGIKNFKEGMKHGSDTTSAKDEVPAAPKNPEV